MNVLMDKKYRLSVICLGMVFVLSLVYIISSFWLKEVPDSSVLAAAFLCIGGVSGGASWVDATERKFGSPDSDKNS